VVQNLEDWKVGNYLPAVQANIVVGVVVLVDEEVVVLDVEEVVVLVVEEVVVLVVEEVVVLVVEEVVVLVVEEVVGAVDVAMQLHTLLILLAVHSAGTHVGVELWLVVLV
jgi:hypothetical protein